MNCSPPALGRGCGASAAGGHARCWSRAVGRTARSTGCSTSCPAAVRAGRAVASAGSWPWRWSRRAPERVSPALPGLDQRPRRRRGAAGGLGGRSGPRSAAGARARDLQRDLLPALLSPAPRRARPSWSRPSGWPTKWGSGALDAQLAAAGHPGRRAARTGPGPGAHLVLAGAADRLCPVDRHEEIAALIPGARLVVLDGWDTCPRWRPPVRSPPRCGTGSPKNRPWPGRPQRPQATADRPRPSCTRSAHRRAQSGGHGQPSECAHRPRHPSNRRGGCDVLPVGASSAAR